MSSEVNVQEKWDQCQSDKETLEWFQTCKASVTRLCNVTLAGHSTILLYKYANDSVVDEFFVLEVCLLCTHHSIPYV